MVRSLTVQRPARGAPSPGRAGQGWAGPGALLHDNRGPSLAGRGARAHLPLSLQSAAGPGRVGGRGAAGGGAHAGGAGARPVPSSSRGRESAPVPGVGGRAGRRGGAPAVATATWAGPGGARMRKGPEEAEAGVTTVARERWRGKR